MHPYEPLSSRPFKSISPNPVYNEIMTTTTLAARPLAQLSVVGRPQVKWFTTFVVVYGLWVWLPWLAPVFMHIGWARAGQALYFFYSFFCHQLPERSLFLFGHLPMYPLTQIQAAWRNTLNPMVLRQFVGNRDMGWKVAWSDRMISFYGSVWVFGILWWALRRKIKALPWWGFFLLLVPIVVDGGTHAISDLAGLGQGFRATNAWLSTMTGNALPASFYAGDLLGSFNSWMRWLTGVLAGLGIAWFVFPHVEASFA